MSHAPIQKLFETDHPFGDALVFTREPQQIFGVNDDGIQPVKLAEPSRAKGHSDIVTIGLNAHFRHTIFRNPIGVWRLNRRSFHQSHFVVLPSPAPPARASELNLYGFLKSSKFSTMRSSTVNTQGCLWRNRHDHGIVSFSRAANSSRHLPRKVPQAQEQSMAHRFGMKSPAGDRRGHSDSRQGIARGVSRDLSGSLDSSSMVERLAVNEDAAGSNPAYPAKFLLPANSPDIREFAALVFVGLFGAVVLVALLLLRLIPFGEMFR